MVSEAHPRNGGSATPLRLAEVHRELAWGEDVAAVERDLRALFDHADRDFWVWRQLQERAGWE